MPYKDNAGYRAYYKRKARERPGFFLHKSAKQRAKAKGLPFDLTPEDIVIPTHCPILKYPLVVNGGYNSPTLDRIIPAKGYVKGNVWVISKKANVMKQDATPEELRRFGEWTKTFQP